MKSPLRQKQRDSNGVRTGGGGGLILICQQTIQTALKRLGVMAVSGPLLKKPLLVRLSVTYNEGVKDKEKRE